MRYSYNFRYEVVVQEDLSLMVLAINLYLHIIVLFVVLVSFKKTLIWLILDHPHCYQYRDADVYLASNTSFRQ